MRVSKTLWVRVAYFRTGSIVIVPLPGGRAGSAATATAFYCFDGPVAILLLRRHRLQPGAVSRGIPYIEPHPLFPSGVEGNPEGFHPERLGTGQGNDLAIHLRPVAPYQLGKLQRKGVFDAGRVDTLRAGSFDPPFVEENLACGARSAARPRFSSVRLSRRKFLT